MPSIRGTDTQVTLISITSSTAIQISASVSSPFLATIGGQQYRRTTPLTLDISVSGAGGIDTGAVGANTYFIFLTVNLGGLALVASLSSSAPTGFSASRLIGRMVVGYNANVLNVLLASPEDIYQVNLNEKAPNILVNGDMAIAQRGVGPTAITSSVRFVVDRWNTFRTTDATGLTASRQLSGIASLPYCYRLQRNSGDTSTQKLITLQNVITENALKYSGKVVTLSFYARRGPTASSSSLAVIFASGTGTNQSLRTGYTGQVTVMSTSVTLTTSWQRFSFALLIPSSSTQFAPSFEYTPTGTAGANDYFELTGVMLNEGGIQDYRGVGPNLADDFIACQQYYELIQGFVGYCEGTATASITGNFAVQKWTVPTILTIGSVGMRAPSGGQDFTSASPTIANQTATVKGFWTQVTGFASLPNTLPITDRVFNSNIRAEAEIY
jgi:hypothetical protein